MLRHPSPVPLDAPLAVAPPNCKCARLPRSIGNPSRVTDIRPKNYKKCPERLRSGFTDERGPQCGSDAPMPEREYAWDGILEGLKRIAAQNPDFLPNTVLVGGAACWYYRLALRDDARGRQSYCSQGPGGGLGFLHRQPWPAVRREAGLHAAEEPATGPA